MAPNLTHYNPKSVILLVGGIPITGFAEGDDVIMAERREDALELIVGMQGDGTATHRANESGTVTIKLMYASPSNAYLAARFKLQSQRNAHLSVVIKDANNPTEFVSARYGLIVSPPPMGYGEGHSPREWQLVCLDLEMMPGGQL